MSEQHLRHNEKVKTEVLRHFDISKKHRLTIEKVVEHRHRLENQYIVKSFTKGLFGYKLNSLAAWNVQSDEKNLEFIDSFQFKAFRLLRQGIDYAKYVKHKKYANWIRYQ